MHRTPMLLMFCLIGCGGPTGDYLRAEDTVRVASGALTDVAATSGGEATPEQEAALESAIQESRDWLSPAEAAIEMWEEGGDVAYSRAAACLGAALGQVREKLVAMQRDVPAGLSQAESQALAAAEHTCGDHGE